MRDGAPRRVFRFGMGLAVGTVAMNVRTACPFLKEVVMIYCDACPSHKLLRRDQVVSLGPCSESFESCPLFREIARGIVSSQATTAGPVGHGKEVKP
jgi:hypothetical protein